jgi:hypothetical protein
MHRLRIEFIIFRIYFMRNTRMKVHCIISSLRRRRHRRRTLRYERKRRGRGGKRAKSARERTSFSDKSVSNLTHRIGHRRGALTVDRGGGLLDLLLDLHLLLLCRGSSAAASASTAATTSARHGRDNHLRDALGGEEVGEYDGEVGRDLGVARGLEEGVDLIGGDVGLLLCVCVCVCVCVRACCLIGSTKTNTMSEE